MAKMVAIGNTLSVALANAVLLGVTLQSSAAEPPKSGKVGTVKLFVGGTDQCPYCLEVKKRLTGDPALKRLLKHYQVTYVDITTVQAKDAFLKRFHVAKVASPTLVFERSDGSNIRVLYGSPKLDVLKTLMEDALLTASGVNLPPELAAQNIGNVYFPRSGEIEELLKAEEPNGSKARKPEAADAKNGKRDQKKEKLGSSGPANRTTIARDARKLIREGKVAEAVAAVAGFVGQEPRDDSLAGVIKALTHDGKKEIDAARTKLNNGDSRLTGALALVKANRQYGKLSTLRGDFDSALAALEKSTGGKQLKQQAEAVDKGRTLDEAGDKEAALKVYRKIIAEFANTPVAKLAATRVKQLTQ